MNKIITYIVLLCSMVTATATAQTATDTSAVIIEQFIEAPDEMADPPPMAAEPVYVQREFKEGFQDKYTGTEYKYTFKTTAKSWWDRFLEWLGNVLESIFCKGDGQQNDSFNWTDFIIKIVAFTIIGFVIYLIVRAVIDKESMWIFGKSRKQVRVQDAEQENIHEMDFSQLVETTRTSGDYRLAVRYYYLWLLKKLSEREIIEWHWDKTNADYLYEIKNCTLKKDFEYLSYVYDYSWYGDFPVDEKAFAKAEKAFRNTLNTL